MIVSTLVPAAKQIEQMFGLSSAELENLCANYRDMLKASPEGRLAKIRENPMLDALWHMHIVDMDNYENFCHEVTGRVVKHALPCNPDAKLLEKAVSASSDMGIEIAKTNNAELVLAAAQCSGPAKKTLA